MSILGAWRLPVVLGSSDGSFSSIANATEAIMYLMDMQLFFGDSEMLSIALALCVEACKGTVVPERAREALIDAALEAELDVRSHFSGH